VIQEMNVKSRYPKMARDLNQVDPADVLEQFKGTPTEATRQRLLSRGARHKLTFSSIRIDPVTGQTFVTQNDLFTVGAGYLDVWAALSSIGVAKKPALSPVVSYSSKSGKALRMSDASAVWGTRVFLHANNAVWGTSAVWGTTPPGGASTEAINIAIYGDL
jgi:hypothetical protein